MTRSGPAIPFGHQAITKRNFTSRSPVFILILPKQPGRPGTVFCEKATRGPSVTQTGNDEEENDMSEEKRCIIDLREMGDRYGLSLVDVVKDGKGQW